MKVTPTVIPDVLIIESKVFGDARGFFYESFNQKAVNEATGRDVNFVQNNHCRKGVLRGAAFDVAADIRRSSHAFGKWVGCELSESADFLYKTTDYYYAPVHERCIAWNDPDIGIEWPQGMEPQLSGEDRAGNLLSSVELML